jgi:hypothetical protein
MQTIMSKEKKILKIFNFGELTLPKFKEEVSKGWVTYGDKNLYPEYLVSLKRKSPKHGAILKRKADMIAGKGFIVNKFNEEFIDNSYCKYNLDEVAYMCAYDLVIYGGFALNVVWSIDKTQIAKIEYVDFRKVRISTEVLPQEKKGEFFKPADIEYFWYSDNWSNVNKYEPELIQGFSKKYRGQMQGDMVMGSPNQLMYVLEYEPGCDYYTLPDYIAAVDYIELDGEIAQFHLQNVKNGFAPSYIINFNSIPTEDEMDQLYRDMERQYAGTANAGKVILTFSDGKERAPEITKIDLNDSDERYRDLAEQIKENIFIAHSCSEAILGVSTPGKLGGTQEVINSYTIFKEEVIAPKQKKIEDAFNKLASINNIPDLELEDYNPFENLIMDVAPEVAAIDAPEVDTSVVDVAVTEASPVPQNSPYAEIRSSVGGIQALISIQQSVAQGLTSRSSAMGILELIYGFSPAESMKLLGDVQEGDLPPSVEPTI